jgi:septal ring factor EnvC (AmiA/AmiB activator)
MLHSHRTRAVGAILLLEPLHASIHVAILCQLPLAFERTCKQTAPPPLPLHGLQELQRNLDRLTQELRSTRLERQDLSEQLLAANAALDEAQANVQEQAGQLTAATAALEQAEARCGELEVQLQGVEQRCAELKAELAERADEVSVCCCQVASAVQWQHLGPGIAGATYRLQHHSIPGHCCNCWLPCVLVHHPTVWAAASMGNPLFTRFKQLLHLCSCAF